MEPRIIVALDRPGLGEALELVDRLGSRVSFYKVGLTLFTAAGPQAVRALRERDKRVFLDLKLHDIPAQVAGAVERVGALEVELATVHAAGGAEMMRAAAAAAPAGLSLVAVTVLTSQSTPAELVLERAREAIAAGLNGVVASALEAELLRAALGPTPLIITPGIRMADQARDDQMRVATPGAALAAGASHLVIGRPITQASDPVAAVTKLHELIDRAASGGLC